MKVHGYASLSHYAKHLLPILTAIPVEYRGMMWAPDQGRWWGTEIPPDLAAAGDDWMLVAGLADAQRFYDGRPLVYVEHGAGQTYVGLEGHGSYSGGDHNGLGIRLYISPSDEVAARWAPTPAVAVGCPRLDTLIRRGRQAHGQITAGFTWHWWFDVVPEATSAFPHYEQVLQQVVARMRMAGIVPVGHAHPRYAGKMAGWYQAAGIPYIDDLDTLLASVDLLIGDNTSALPEAAACGVPVVWLNCPWYRRNVHHGGRFWNWPTGQIVCDEPDQLYDAVMTGLADTPEVRASRQAMVNAIYAHTDGRSSERAATAIVEAMGR